MITINDLLNMIKDEIEAQYNLDDVYLESRGQANGFEKLFIESTNQVIDKNKLESDVEVIEYFGHHFPDVGFVLIADITMDKKKYGVEIKSRNNGSWQTTGNSVFESITDDYYDEVFLFFGSRKSNERNFSCRFKPYWQTTVSVSVTHSPRFKIDMSNKADSVFKDKSAYDNLRDSSEEEKIAAVQKYLREETKELKWYTLPEQTEEPEVSAENFSSLNIEKRHQIMAECYVLFPSDMFEKRSVNYPNIAQYMVDVHFVYSYNLRDHFSASGRAEIEDHDIDIPRVLENLRILNSLVKDFLSNEDESIIKFIQDSWLKQSKDNKAFPKDLITDNLEKSYRQIIDYLLRNNSYYDDITALEDYTINNFI